MNPQKNKFSAFAAAEPSDWQQAAAAELQGSDPWNKLTRNVQGLSIKPYYDRRDSPTDPLRLAPAQETYRGPRTWFNCPRVKVFDSTLANATALEHLQSGADGILFELTEPVDFKTLLRNIEWAFCSLNFLAPDATKADADALAAYLKSFQGSAPGVWFGPNGERLPEGRSFRRHGILLAQTGTPAQNIAQLFAKICSSPGSQFPERSHDVAIGLELGTDFFVEIAKLRALRQTWQRLVVSRGVNAAQDLHLHAISRSWTAEAYSPHGNMIRATTTAMAAILGGCDVLTVDPERDDGQMEIRIARNTAILLREESRFSKVADPLAGAYFIDQLSNEISDQAWTSLQSLLPR